MVKHKKKDELIPQVKNNDDKSKPTPEQMRIAQILDHRIIDSTIKLKLRQLMDATQRSADDVYVALHDSDFDANRAVDLLIEGVSQSDWCTREKKKKKLQELKEKKTATAQEEQQAPAVVPDQNEEAPKIERNLSFKGRGDDRRRTGRGRGANVSERRPRGLNEDSENARGRGFRGRGGKRLPRNVPGTMIFERSVTQEPTKVNAFQLPIKNRWERPLIRSAEEDWDTEEFTGSLSQTQVFTSKVKPELTDCEIPVEDIVKAAQLSNDVGTTPPPLSLPVTLPQSDLVQPKHFRSTAAMSFTPITKSVIELETAPPSILTQPSNTQPTGPRSERLFNLSTHSQEPPRSRVSSTDEKKRPPSKIPTSAVEMPPETMSSLSFLDVQFGAMDLSGLEATNSESSSNNSSQNSSSTTLTLPSSNPSSGSIDHLMTGNIISSNSINNLAQNFLASGMNGLNVSDSYSSVNGMNHEVPSSGISSAPRVNSRSVSDSMPLSGNVNIIPSAVTLNQNTTSSNHMIGVTSNMTSSNHLMSTNRMAPTNHLMATNSLASSNHVLGSNCMTSSNHIMATNNITSSNHMMPTNSMASSNHIMSTNSMGSSSLMMGPNLSSGLNSTQSQSGRYMTSSQSFNTAHMPYSYMTPSNGGPTHQYNTRTLDTNTTIPPPHMATQPGHLPPFKQTPPGVPKGAIVANLPPGSMVGNQYMIGQGNVPYFSQPIYYYEEVPSVMNDQQRLAHHMTSGYDVGYQASNPTTRDGAVHYNV